MIPTLFEIGPFPVRTHDVFVLIGVVVAVVVLGRRTRVLPRDPQLWILVAGGLFTGAIFAKLGTGWQ